MISQIEVNEFVNKFTTSQDSILEELERETFQKTVYPQMMCSIEQGKILQFISQMLRPKYILEIGTFTGYATACLTENASQETQIHTIEADLETAFKTKSFWKNYNFMNKVHFHEGPALDILPQLNLNPDFIFVDADKHNYINYFNLCFPILQKGGIMLFDNTLWSGKVLDKDFLQNDKDTKNMHAFNQELSKCSNWKTLLLPIRDGLTAIIKN